MIKWEKGQMRWLVAASIMMLSQCHRFCVHPRWTMSLLITTKRYHWIPKPADSIATVWQSRYGPTHSLTYSFGRTFAHPHNGWMRVCVCCCAANGRNDKINGWSSVSPCVTTAHTADSQPHIRRSYTYLFIILSQSLPFITITTLYTRYY